MRAAAAEAVQRVLDCGRANVADDRDFWRLCSRLAGSWRQLQDAKGKVTDHGTRAEFYRKPLADERRQFMPSTPSDLEAAHYVALISDLSAEWIHDCYTERRKCTRDGDKQGTS